MKIWLWAAVTIMTTCVQYRCKVKLAGLNICGISIPKRELKKKRVNRLQIIYERKKNCPSANTNLNLNHFILRYDISMNYGMRKNIAGKKIRCFISHRNTWYNTIHRKEKKKMFRIFRGCGTTDSYEWVERDDHLEIRIRLPENLKAENIQYCLKPDYIFIKLKDRAKCIIEGKLKGQVDTMLSTWFLENFDGCSILNIFLKKKSRGINEWVGVVEKESIIHLSYDGLPSGHREDESSFLTNAKENELLYSHFFENAKFHDVYTLLLKWVSKKATGGNDFGIPTTKLKTTVMQTDDEIEILITGFDMKWKAEDSVVLKLSDVKNGIMLHVFRGKVATGLLGKHGAIISMMVKDCEERILKKLQHDIKGVFYLNPLYEKMENMMHKHGQETHYRLADKDKKETITEERKDDKLPHTEQCKEKNETEITGDKELEKNLSKHDTQNSEEEEKKKDDNPKEIKEGSAEESLIVKKLNLESKVELSCKDKNKEPEFMKNWSEEKKIEFRRNSVLELKHNLELSQEKKISANLEDYVNHMKALFDLSDDESKLLWKKAFKKSQEQKERRRFQQFIEIEQLTDRIQSYGFGETDDQLNKNKSTENSVGDTTQQQISFNVDRKNVNRQFLHVLDNDLSYPVEEKKETLYEFYSRSTDEEKKEMRKKWQVNEIRLNTLIEELRYIGDDDSIVPTVCNNYREMLLSEEYSCLMRLRMVENPPKTEEEKRVLQKINFFVMSLYDDVKIIMEHEEKEHLKKIRLICQKAIEDEKGLNEYIESMKPLLDYSFLAYIKHAIEIEKKNLHLQNIDYREKPSDWLIILLIIKKGVYSILEKDIWQDVLHISTIICHEQPSVRKTLLQTIVASMPKADWIFFKDLINTLYLSVLEKKLTVNHLPNFPHAIEAIFQLHFDIEQILPDWFIKEMLDEYDKSVIEEMKQKKPIFWKMKETQWDKKFVNDFKQKQVQKFREYVNSNLPCGKTGTSTKHT